MEKKKDLRIQKTEKAIRETFLEIRKKLPLEKVRVRSICQQAMINTSTFYNHYMDVLDLSEQLENEIIKECVGNIQNIDCLFSDPYRFLTDLWHSFSESEQAETLLILFHDRHEELHRKMDYLLSKRCQETIGTDAYNVKISFVISGIMHIDNLIFNEDNYAREKLYHELADLILRLQ